MLQASQRYGNSRAIWDHIVLPATRQRWHSRLYPSKLRLVLDLATPEGCKAEKLEYWSDWCVSVRTQSTAAINRCSTFLSVRISRVPRTAALGRPQIGLVVSALYTYCHLVSRLAGCMVASVSMQPRRAPAALDNDRLVFQPTPLDGVSTACYLRNRNEAGKLERWTTVQK